MNVNCTMMFKFVTVFTKLYITLYLSSRQRERHENPSRWNAEPLERIAEAENTIRSCAFAPPFYVP
jgi:hypothetical protein